MVSRCFKSTPAPAITSTNGRHADQLADPDSIPNGERNTTLAKIGGAMRRQGATQESITAALLSENNSRCDPPLPDAEVESIAASVSRYEPAGHQLNDAGNAHRLAERHGQELRYCDDWRKWLIWDGNRWASDRTGEIVRRAKDTVVHIYMEAAAVSHDEDRKKLGKYSSKP